MKYYTVVLLLLISFVGKGQISLSPLPEVPPTDASLKDLRWSLGNVLSMQLPSSLPDSLNGKTYLKTFSVNISRADSLSLEIPELRRTVEKDSTFGGSKYYLPLQAIDIENVRIIITHDERFSAIIIPAKPGQSFLHRPYGYEPDRQVEVVTIGWYDRLQDQTLARAYVLWRQFLRKMGE